MSERHTALLVEDDLETAQEFGDLIRSLGHSYKHTVSQEGAKALVAEYDFCYALIDLQIKVTDKSALPLVDAGQNLVKELRHLFPRRNSKTDGHHLPILVMSGHAKDTPSAVKALQDGGDDFIMKPLQDGHQGGLGQTIREALRKSDREDHSSCASATMEAIGEARGRWDAVPTIARVDLTGRQVARRIEVRVSEKSLLVTNNTFLMLLQFIVNRLRGPDAWVHKSELGFSGEHGWKGMTRFKEELKAGLPLDFDPIVNDKSGRYRLHPGVALGRVDTSSLAKSDDHRIVELAGEISRLQKDVGRRMLSRTSGAGLPAHS